ncbi:MAG: oligosaccharide flippase family protein [Candidatus Marinimicrobia bacterium]|nr:oligosaccharide flippase family protein [Candidatus Neomarinimicrobiota bacterium]
MSGRLLKHSLIYTSGNVLARGLNFIIQVIIWSNLFPPEAYGQIAYCYVFISFVTVILPFGFDAAFLNFYVRKKERSAFLTNSLVFIFMAGLLFVGIAFVFRDSLSMIAIRADAPKLLNLSLLILFFDLLNNQGILFLRAEESGFSVVLQNVEIILRLILLILLVSVFSASIEYILWANAASSFVLLAVLAGIMIPRITISRISKPVMKEMFIFGLPFMISGIFDRTIELADRRLLGHFMGDETVGLYVACYTVAVLIRLLIYSFNAGWQPFFLREIDKKGGLFRIERIYVQTAAVFILLWFLASVWVPEIVRIPLGEGRHILHSAYWAGIPADPGDHGRLCNDGIVFFGATGDILP